MIRTRAYNGRWRIAIRDTATLPFLGLTLAALLSAAPRVPAEQSPDDFVHDALARVDLGDPVVADPLILIPLLRLDSPEDIGVGPAVGNERVGYAEPEFPRRRWDVAVRNDSDTPVLVVGGTVLVGGRLDRLIRHDAIVPAGATAEIESLPAAWLSERRRDPVPFTASDTFAPFFLRQRAQYGGSDTLVQRFVARWLDFRNKGDERRSLAAISESTRLKTFCVACEEATRKFPEPLAGKRVVGCVIAVRGRVQAFALYGTNALLRAHFEQLVRSATFAAAALELRAKEIGLALIPPEERAELLDAVRGQASDLLGRLRKALVRRDELREGLLGEAYLLRLSDGTRGRMIAFGGRVVHLAVYPDDPFERALYGEDVEPPPDEPTTPPETSVPALERKRDTGRRLTEAEKRLLDRLRG